MNRNEITARFEIKEETFLKKIQIESRVLADIAINHIIPTAINYQNVLIENIRGIKEIFPDKVTEYAGSEIENLERIVELSNSISLLARKMTDMRRANNMIENIPQRAETYERDIVPIMNEIRLAVDELELIVDDSMWPMTKYSELLSSL